MHSCQELRPRQIKLWDQSVTVILVGLKAMSDSFPEIAPSSLLVRQRSGPAAEQLETVMSCSGTLSVCHGRCVLVKYHCHNSSLILLLLRKCALFRYLHSATPALCFRTETKNMRENDYGDAKVINYQQQELFPTNIWSTFICGKQENGQNIHLLWQLGRSTYRHFSIIPKCF